MMTSFMFMVPSVMAIEFLHQLADLLVAGKAWDDQFLRQRHGIRAVQLANVLDIRLMHHLLVMSVRHAWY